MFAPKCCNSSSAIAKRWNSCYPRYSLARFSEGHCFVCLNIYLGIYVLNPLVPSILNIERLAKILILIWDGIAKKNFYERRAYESVDEQSYLKLCHETRREKESGHEWVNIYLSINVCVCVCVCVCVMQFKINTEH